MPQILSDGNLTKNFSNNIEYTTLTSTHFFTNTNFAIMPYISFMKAYNPLPNVGVGVEILTSNIAVGSNNFGLRLNIVICGVVSLIKVTAVIVDLNIIHSYNKVYYVSPLVIMVHNISGQAEYWLSSVFNNSFFPTTYGPNFSRNCTFGLITAFNVNNGLLKY